MKYFSLFSGIGGFEYGVKKAFQYLEGNVRNSLQYKRDKSNIMGKREREHRSKCSHCIGYSEIDKYAEAIYKFHYPKQKNYGNAKRIIPEELPNFDLLCAGFPCQAFSIAGKRGGFDDTRGTLFFEICRIARAKRPNYLLLENVRGLLSHDEGRTFLVILQSLDELGYDLQWQVLNSKDWGVPQNRERVFIVGHLRGKARPEVFPIKESEKLSYTRKSGIYCLDANYYKGVCKQGRAMICEIEKGRSYRVYNSDGISPTLPTPGGGHHIPKISVWCVDDGVSSKFQKQPMKERSPALKSSRADYTIGIKDMKIRRLTPIECERLQGFPDDWTKWGIMDGKKVEISDTQRYKCLGNAVTTNVIQAIMERWINV